jgi:hypothetical protein
MSSLLLRPQCVVQDGNYKSAISRGLQCFESKVLYIDSPSSNSNSLNLGVLHIDISGNDIFGEYLYPFLSFGSHNNNLDLRCTDPLSEGDAVMVLGTLERLRGKHSSKLEHMHE